MTTEPDVEEFIDFITLLKDEAPEDYTPWLFRVEAGSKAPDTSYGSWKDEDARLTPNEAVEWMQSGGNVGIAGTPEDALVNVDIDDEDETTIDDLKPTLIARSRSRTGVHAWYFETENGEIPNIPTDSAGEIRANWQYVVAPGSYVETDPEDVPEEHREHAGYYTVERGDPVAEVTYDELPDVFIETYEEAQQDDKEPELEDEPPAPTETDSGSALFEIDAEDVIAKERGSVDADSRWASIFHGSDTGKNMSLSRRGLLQCWRHEVAHNGLQALAVLSDYPHDCQDVGSPHASSGAGSSCIHTGDDHIWHAWKYAKENGYIPDDDPVPYRALCHIARKHELCPVTDVPKGYDPEEGVRLPAEGYDAAISIIENHHELDSGRKKTGEIGDDNSPTIVEEQSRSQDTNDEEADDEEAPEPPDEEADDEVGPRRRAARLIRDEVLIPYDPPDDYDGPTIDKQSAIHRSAEIYHQELAWLRPRKDTRGWRATLYNYVPEDGIYEPHGEAELERMIDNHFGPLADNEFVNQVIRKVERMARTRAKRLDEAPEEIVVANGVLDLTTGELHDHTPDKYHQTMVDIEYHPDAECPRIDSFLHDVVEGSDVPTLYRLIAHCLYKEYEAEKAAMLLGDGQNGKSVFLSLVEEFLGEWNVSNQSLQKLNEDDWAANNLVGKLANVHPDMSDQTVQTMQMFKKLTGRDTVAADVKFETPVHFENHATLIFACNRMPVLKDDTRGNWRRWILIDFPNTFERHDDDFVEKHVLMDELTAEKELQGLLARCVEEISEWADGREWFPTTPSWKQARQRIRRAAEPIYDYAHACLEDDEGYISTDEVRRCYRRYAEEEGLPTMSREEFGRKLLNQTDFAIEKTQRRVNGTRTQVYEGVGFTQRGKELAGELPQRDTNQDSLGGPQGRAKRVVELCSDLKGAVDDDAVSHDMLVGRATADGMEVDQVEAAIEKAKQQGGIQQPTESGYLPTI